MICFSYYFILLFISSSITLSLSLSGSFVFSSILYSEYYSGISDLFSNLVPLVFVMFFQYLYSLKYSWSSIAVEYFSLNLLQIFWKSLLYSFYESFYFCRPFFCCSFPGGPPFLIVYLHFLLLWLFCIVYILF